jgi:hypothetical protein
MSDLKVRRVWWLLGVLLSLQMLGLAMVRPVPGQQAAAQTVTVRASEPVMIDLPPATTTTTTVPPVPVLTDGVVPNPFTPGNRPPVPQVQAAFNAPVVDSPDDLIRFQPAYELIREIAIARWGEGEWLALELLLMHESRFDPRAVQPDTGACGLFQALECGKMERIDWRGQIEWGLNVYIPQRYGTPSAAWAFWLSKSRPCVQNPHPYGFVACGGWY